MKEEIIKTEDGIDWIKFHLSPGERLRRFGRLLPDLFLPDFWDGEKTVYDSLSGRWETFMGDLKEGLLGYWIGCQPSEDATPDEIEKDILKRQHADPDFLLCRHGEKVWSGGDPVCAFDEDGKFRENNWGCLLMDKVRTLMGQWDEGAPGYTCWDNDQNHGVLFISSWINGKEVDSYLRGCFVILDWYKSRGKTDSFRILGGDGIHEGTEADAQEITKIYSAYLDEEDE